MSDLTIVAIYLGVNLAVSGLAGLEERAKTGHALSARARFTYLVAGLVIALLALMGWLHVRLARARLRWSMRSWDPVAREREVELLCPSDGSTWADRH